jgi:hypothetical protein
MSLERWHRMSCTGFIWIRTKPIAGSCSTLMTIRVSLGSLKNN